MPVARSVALACVKLPLICAWPPEISCSVVGSVRNLPQTVVGVWAAKQPVSYGAYTWET